MKLPTFTRQLSPEEHRVLYDLVHKPIPPIDWTWVMILPLLAGLCAWGAFYADGGFWTGILSLAAFVMGMFGLWDLPRKKLSMQASRKKEQAYAATVLKEGVIVVTRIAAGRRILAPEVDDEGDLWILERLDGTVAYYWDYLYEIAETEPETLDVYEDRMAAVMGRAFAPLGEAPAPVRVNEQQKVAYCDQYDAGHLEYDPVSFDDVLRRFDQLTI
ncbi:hypothetical protein ACWKWU_05340 [Chitinophaga lutea]